MADTERADFGSVPCSDCGLMTGVYIKHWGPMVPPGTVGYFDGSCWRARLADHECGFPPRPLGSRKRVVH